MNTTNGNLLAARFERLTFKPEEHGCAVLLNGTVLGRSALSAELTEELVETACSGIGRGLRGYRQALVWLAQAGSEAPERARSARRNRSVW